ncbi:MAG: hypothetical protein NTV68_13115 [Methanomicrobiales archaeon]|nr:hypothetical protein [Methanomicrobiales archaeon]
MTQATIHHKVKLPGINPGIFNRNIGCPNRHFCRMKPGPRDMFPLEADLLQEHMFWNPGTPGHLEARQDTIGYVIPHSGYTNSATIRRTRF